ncbi:unnamed protein product [Durusdinium trenchii]|uniref:ADP,ATP carrier protein n=1 Tax=Durusdinium trenchii TaxID=1381693 RepID=A0ABP0IMF9_9DINO
MIDPLRPGMNGDGLIRRCIDALPEVKKVVAGGIAGCVSKTAVAPLSRVTILMQVQSMRPHKFVDGKNPNNQYRLKEAQCRRTYFKVSGRFTWRKASPASGEGILLHAFIVFHTLQSPSMPMPQSERRCSKAIMPPSFQTRAGTCWRVVELRVQRFAPFTLWM